ncbi:MAG: DUF429 domain-containing protein [Candidatus Bipolaricaulota bacterium]
MRFAGLGLAWSRRRTTGGAILSWGGTVARPMASDSVLGDDEDILAFPHLGVGEDGALVAINAPLVVPNQTGTRPCDQAVSAVYRAHHAGAYPANRSRLGPEVRGEALATRFQDQGFTASPLVRRWEEVRQVVEVYPHPAMIEVFGLARRSSTRPAQHEPYHSGGRNSTG